MNTMEKVLALGSKAQTMSLDEIADAVGMDDEERRGFKHSAVAARTAWGEVGTGLPCECGKKMLQFTGVKRTLVEDGKGFDFFEFKCECGNKVDRRWRAPALDGLTFDAYRTTYTFK